jgi:hypothetical protein
VTSQAEVAAVLRLLGIDRGDRGGGAGGVVDDASVGGGGGDRVAIIRDGG